MHPETPDQAPPFHQYWQEILPADAQVADAPYQHHFPALLPDGRQLRLPIRPLPDGSRATASLIMNQASFAVVDALAAVVADRMRDDGIDLVVAVPTLGMPFAEAIARRLGHSRLIPLSTSRKFWYDEGISEPLSSITSPEQVKRLYLDPRMLPLVKGHRIALVDDVTSSGRSLLGALRLLHRIGAAPTVLAVAMTQSDRWRPALAALAPDAPDRMRSAIHSPLLERNDDDTWSPITTLG